MGKGYFVTGTDTGVGKTLVTCALLRALAQRGKTVAGMKPVAAGCDLTASGVRCDDVERLRANSNVQVPDRLINPYSFAPPIAPHIAARQAAVEIDLRQIVSSYQALQGMADTVLVEGVGGFVVPLNDRQTTADLAVMLGLPIILVVGMRLGCINHALLTEQVIHNHGLKVAGWVANQIDPGMQAATENLQSLKDRVDAPLLGFVPYDGQANPAIAARCLDINILNKPD